MTWLNKKKKKNHLIFPELWPLENFGILKKIRMKSLQQDISKSINFELGA